MTSITNAERRPSDCCHLHAPRLLPLLIKATFYVKKKSIALELGDHGMSHRDGEREKRRKGERAGGGFIPKIEATWASGENKRDEKGFHSYTAGVTEEQWHNEMKEKEGKGRGGHQAKKTKQKQNE